MIKRLARSTSFRLTAMLGLAFLLMMLGTGYAAFQLIRAQLDERMTAQLQETYTVIAQSYGDLELDDLLNIVQSNVTANPEHERVFLLLAPDGARLAGNIAMMPTSADGSIVTAQDLGLPASYGSYRIRRGDIGDYPLLIGMSFAESDATAAIVLQSLALGGVTFTMLIMAAGYFVATKSQRRIDRIADTMARIGRGELTARIPVIQNRDDLDDLSLQINAALDRLSTLVESMRQVSVDIAHDLKNPLNRLYFTLQSAREMAEAGKPVGSLLVQAQEESAQINTIFEALLRIAQIESGARRARFQRVQVDEVLTSLFEAYEQVAVENGQTLTLTQTAAPPITGDKDLLTQLFANVIENAIRHCPTGTKIALFCTNTPTTLDVVIADNGPGIPSAEHEKILQRLYRLDKSRTTPGNGLGLSLVKAIADLHQAGLAVEDNHPGLRLTFSFPIVSIP